MAKDKKGKLPKQIGGMKLPKKARKQANKAIAALNQPMVRELAAAALAAASAVASKRAKAAPEAKPSGAPTGGAQFAEVAAGVAMAALSKWLAGADGVAAAAPALKAETGSTR